MMQPIYVFGEVLYATGRVSVSLDGGEPSYEIVAERTYDFIASDALPATDPGLIYVGRCGGREAGRGQARIGEGSR